MPAKRVPAASSTAAGCEQTATIGELAEGFTVLLIMRAAFSPSTTAIARSAGSRVSKQRLAKNAGRTRNAPLTQEENVERNSSRGQDGFRTVRHHDDPTAESLQHRFEDFGHDRVSPCDEAVDRREAIRRSGDRRRHRRRRRRRRDAERSIDRCRRVGRRGHHRHRRRVCARDLERRKRLDPGRRRGRIERFRLGRPAPAATRILPFAGHARSFSAKEARGNRTAAQARGQRIAALVTGVAHGQAGLARAQPLDTGRHLTSRKLARMVGTAVAVAKGKRRTTGRRRRGRRRGGTAEIARRRLERRECVRTRRKELLVFQLADHVVVRLFENREIPEVERAEIVELVRRGCSLRPVARSANRFDRLAKGRRNRLHLSDCRVVGEGRVARSSDFLGGFGIFLLVVVLLTGGTSGIEVIRRLGVVHLRNKVDRLEQQIVPVDAVQERMRLDLLGAFHAESSSRVRDEEPVDKVACLCRDLDDVFVPFELARQDVLKDLLGGLVVERRDAVQKPVPDVPSASSTRKRLQWEGNCLLVGDDAQRPPVDSGVHADAENALGG